MREKLAGQKDANKEMLLQHGSLLALVADPSEYQVIVEATDMQAHEQLLTKLCATGLCLYLCVYICLDVLGMCIYLLLLMIMCLYRCLCMLAHAFMCLWIC